MKILLASKSPRRVEILTQIIGDRFENKASVSDEHFIGETPEQTVLEIARGKLKNVVNPEEYDVIIACDTLVYFDGKYYGKPSSRDEARCMLRELSNNTHIVYSGLIVKKGDAIVEKAVASQVTFKKLSDDNIESYLDNYEYMDKAGAYGIQDNVLVEKCMEKDYYNVMGMPKEVLEVILRELGIIDEKNQ